MRRKHLPFHPAPVAVVGVEEMGPYLGITHMVVTGAEAGVVETVV